MKILVIYKSKTGFTKWYAEIIAKVAKAELIDFKDMTTSKMSEFDVVVYGGGLYVGKVNGFKKAKEMFAKSSAKKLVVFATGGTPNSVTEEIERIWKNNLSEEEIVSISHFYMQAGLCYEKMSFPDRTLMKMLAKVLDKKQNKNEFEEGWEQAIKKSYNISDEKYIQPLIKCLQDE